MERRRAARAATQRDTPASGMTAAPAGKRETPEPRFPHGMRNAAAPKGYEAGDSDEAKGCLGQIFYK
jgi:hypothetical protein